jgi:Methyltransferase domain
VTDEQPRLYGELASWFHLLTAPEDYGEEAQFYGSLILEAAPTTHTLLELGSGGGNNASHLKALFSLTLVDRSPGMLELSSGLNPECEHVLGDMRSIRLGRSFDAVFIHDAIAYMTSEADLCAVMETAFVHCRPGGAALLVPDVVRERFRAGTRHGGHDGDGRSLRHLEWTWDPDPGDTTYLVDHAYLLRDEAGEVRAVHDRHVCGVFSRETWLGCLEDAGFRPEVRNTSWDSELFLARKPD